MQIIWQLWQSPDLKENLPKMVENCLQHPKGGGKNQFLEKPLLLDPLKEQKVRIFLMFQHSVSLWIFQLEEQR